MTKELEALQEIKYMLASPYTSGVIKQGLEIIETALKEYGKIKQEVKDLRLAFYRKNNEVLELCNTYEKKLKALEIIKKKKVDIPMFIYNQQIYGKFFTCDAYNRRKDNWLPLLTQEEFDLLKEVLL